MFVAIFSITNQAIMNETFKHIMITSQLKQEFDIVKSISDEYFEILDSLHEGIALFKGGSVTFSNGIFKDIMKSYLSDDSEQGEALNRPIFKVFRQSENTDEKDGQSGKRFEREQGENKGLMSLNDLLLKPETYFEDKIFQVKSRERENFKHV
jgi:hypothetical protein